MRVEIREFPIRFNKTSSNEGNLCKLAEKMRVSFFVLGVKRSGNPRDYVGISCVWRILLP